MRKNPIQPLVHDELGTLRFKSNRLVVALLDYASANGLDMNELAETFAHPKHDDDRQQLSQLIGYSLSSYGEQSYVSDEAYELAAAKAEQRPAPKHPDDRERRIRELVREWIGRHGGTRQVEPTDAERLIGRAAEFIDALDATEVPPKDAGGES